MRKGGNEALGKLSRRRRLAQIATAFGRHGSGYLLIWLGLDGVLPFHQGRFGHPRRDEPYAAPDHVRLALEELGTTAIKLGQILSTRPDLVPPAYVDEFSKLRDRVTPVPTAAIRRVIEQDLGRPVEGVFARFDEEPLATASIGQVHAARLFTGEEVVVKVQKPGIADQVEVDLRLLRDLAETVQRRSALGRDYDISAIVDEFAWTLRGELDYEQEGRNADAFRRQFVGNSGILIPRIHWPQTTGRVLTMQRLSGVTIDDLEGLERLGVDRHELAVRSAHLILSEIFEHGFYHADPHPGNFLILPGGTVAALDFGMVGRVSRGAMLDLLEVLSAVVDRDPARIVDAFEALGIVGVTAHRSALERDIGRLLDRFLGRPLAEVRMDILTGQIFALSRRYRLRMPAELALLLKTLAMNEGVGRHLDPSFNAVAVAAPFVRRVMRRRLYPSAWEPELRKGLVDLARASLDVPGVMRRFGRRLDRGDLTVQIRPTEIEEPLRRIEAIANRLALSVLAGAFIVGTGFLMTVYHPGNDATWIGWFFAVGLAAAALLGIWLVVTIGRSGRH